MPGRIHGKNGEVKMDPTGGATSVAVANLNEWSLDMSKDKVDVTCFQDTNKRSVLGLPGFEGTVSGFWDSGALELMRAIMGDVAVTLNLVPDITDPTFFFGGLAYLDGNIKCDAKGAVTLGGKFVAADNWTLEPPDVLTLERAA